MVTRKDRERLGCGGSLERGGIRVWEGGNWVECGGGAGGCEVGVY